ncbi:MAG: hypothetical protein A2287_08005 [Candidatus Melainabacteria bacterium RIFOXYA12_FULL_32_12]|nr:MAG: hypothetical protein A2255_08925 [Candidatus Melainabacteria bacterium RIFOXYA2_FULL_32_9]OGI25930.1 MAG: hypothetical protein A2287_08005 [Candidatus Melainabacteria bacterium RIFOXYA12_FULL_32_12]
MKIHQKKLILLLSLVYLQWNNPVSTVYSQDLLPAQFNPGVSSGISTQFDLKINKEKFNDIPDSIINPCPQDALKLDSAFYPNLDSSYGDLSGLDILTFDRLKEKFVKAKKEKNKNGIKIEDIPQVYEIALSTLREESKDYIKTVNIGEHGHPENFVNVASKNKSDQHNPDSQVIIDKIKNLISKGKTDEAIKLLDQEAFKPQKDAWYMAELAGLYEQINKYNRATNLYEKALTLKPDRIELLYSYAYCLYKDKKLAKAEKQMKKVLKIDPKFTLAHYNLGNIYFKNGKYYDALKSFNEAIKLNPLSADAYYNTGLILELIGKKDLAVKYYDRCLTLKSDDAQAQEALKRLQKKK